MKKQHWQDWVNLLLGLWVVIAPWTITHVMASAQNPSGVPASAMWDHYFVGIVVAILAAVALSAFQAWEEWVNVALGVWLLLSPWIFGFSASAVLAWNAVIIGVVITWFGGWALSDERKLKSSAR